MKKRLFLILTVCVASLLCFVPFEAYAGFLGKVGSTIFEGIMGFLGFNSDLDGWCWFCPIVRTLLEGANRIAKGIYSATKDGLLMILGVGTLFYIAFKVGAMVVKLQEVDLMQFMGEMFKILGRVIIASVLLMNAPFVVGEIMTPFVAYSSEFAINVINQGESAVSNKLFKSVNKMVDYKNDANGEVSKLNSQINYWKSTEPGKEKPGDDFISPIMVNGMVSIVAKITANLVVGLAVGLVLILFSGLSSLVFPDLQSILSGGVIFMSFAVLFVTVPFQIVNLAIQMVFVLTLLPFWVVLWVFPVTAQYTKKAWDMFVTTCLSIMIFGILAALVLQLLGYMLPNADDILGSMIPGYDLIAGKKASAFSSSTLLTLALGFLCRELLKSAPELASRITSVYGIQAGESMAASISSAIASGAAAGGAMFGLAKAFGGMGVDTAQSVGKKGSETIRGIFGLEEGKSLQDKYLFGSSGSSDSGSKASTPSTYQAPQQSQAATNTTTSTTTSQQTNK